MRITYCKPINIIEEMGKLVNKLRGSKANSKPCDACKDPNSKPWVPIYYNISVVLSPNAFNASIGKYIVYDPYSEEIVVTESKNVDFGVIESFWQVLENRYINKFFSEVNIKIVKKNEESKN